MKYFSHLNVIILSDHTSFHKRSLQSLLLLPQRLTPRTAHNALLYYPALVIKTKACDIKVLWATKPWCKFLAVLSLGLQSP